MLRARKHRVPWSRSIRLSAGLLGATVLALLCAAGALYGDAAMFRGNSGLTGAYEERLNLPLALSWKFTTSYTAYNTSAPAIVGDTAYFAAARRVYAVDANTGALKWQYPQDQALATTISASPAVVDGKVFVGADDGKLYAIQADTGKATLLFDTRSTINSSPNVVDGVVYFGSGDGRVWALDARTGAQIPAWKNGFRASDEITGAPAVANGIVYVLSVDQVLHAISAPTAKERWYVRLPASVLGKSPILSGDTVYVATGSHLMAFRSNNGMRRWTVEFPSEIAVNPAVTEDGIYVVTTDNIVYSVEPRMGRSRWKTSPKLAFDVLAPPSVSGNLLFVGTAQGYLYAIDAQSGGIKWTYAMQPATSRTDSIPRYTNIAAAPVIANKSLYIQSDDGSLSAFRADASDTLGPTMTVVEPEAGVLINGEPPLRFEAKIVDEGSGLNTDSLKLMIDEESIPKRPEGGDDTVGFKYDLETSTLTYITPEPTSAGAIHPLEDGRHTVTITATDWMGNTTTKSWSFTVDNSLARRPSRAERARQRNSQNRGAGPGQGGFGPGIGGGARGGGRGGRGGGARGGDDGR